MYSEPRRHVHRQYEFGSEGKRRRVRELSRSPSRGAGRPAHQKRPTEVSQPGFSRRPPFGGMDAYGNLAATMRFASAPVCYNRTMSVWDARRRRCSSFRSCPGSALLVCGRRETLTAATLKREQIGIGTRPMLSTNELHCARTSRTTQLFIRIPRNWLLGGNIYFRPNLI
jgi:hypothetical protein